MSENGFDGVPNDWNEELWMARTSDGGDLRRLTIRSGNDHWPVAWAPDGKSLVWTADDTEGGADLYIARADRQGRPPPDERPGLRRLAVVGPAPVTLPRGSVRLSCRGLTPKRPVPGV